MAENKNDTERQVELVDEQLEEVAGGNRPGGPVCPHCGAGPDKQVEASVNSNLGLQGFKCTACGKVW